MDACYVVENIEDVPIQEILDKASPMANAVIIEGDQRYVFLRQSFLDRFREDSPMMLLGRTLSSHWGNRTAIVTRSKNTNTIRITPSQKISLKNWCWWATGSSLDFILRQLAVAEEFASKREQLTFKVYEV